MAFSLKSKRSVILGPGLPIRIDAVLSESHESTKEFTPYTVESGRFAFDNSFSLPESLEMTIRVTDTPTDENEDVYEDRHRFIYSQLRIWQELAVPLIVSTGLRTYSSIYIQKLNPVKTPQDGKSIVININFIEIPNTLLGLAFLAANLLIDNDIVYTATNTLDIGVI
jgi:hypothetical protein